MKHSIPHYYTSTPSQLRYRKPALRFAKAGFCAVTILAGYIAYATVALPFYDPFNYAEGSLNTVGSPTWVAGNGTTTEIAVSNAAALTSPVGYPAASAKGVRRSPSGTARRSVLQYASVPNTVSNVMYVSFLL